MVYDTLTAGSSLITKPTTDHIVKWFSSVHIFINFSLILQCIAFCSQIHLIIIHIFKNLCSDPLCFPQSVQYSFFMAFKHYFSVADFNSEFLYCDFRLSISASSHFFVCSWNYVFKFHYISSLKAPFLLWSQYFNFYSCLGRCLPSLSVIFSWYLHYWFIWKKRLCYCHLEFTHTDYGLKFLTKVVMTLLSPTSTSVSDNMLFTSAQFSHFSTTDWSHWFLTASLHFCNFFSFDVEYIYCFVTLGVRKESRWRHRVPRSETVTPARTISTLQKRWRLCVYICNKLSLRVYCCCCKCILHLQQFSRRLNFFFVPNLNVPIG